MSVDHKHSYTYVYPAPASRARAEGQYPYMLCGCGDKSPIADPGHWGVNERGDWVYEPNIFKRGLGPL